MNKLILESTFGKAWELPFKEYDSKDGIYKEVEKDPDGTTLSQYLLRHKLGNYIVGLTDLDKSMTPKSYSEAKYNISSIVLHPLAKVSPDNMFESDLSIYNLGFYIQFHGISLDQSKLLVVFLIENSINNGYPLDNFYESYWISYIKDQLEDFKLITDTLLKPSDSFLQKDFSTDGYSRKC